MVNMRKRRIAAGSLIVAAALLATVPFNMGGCSGSNLDLASITRNAPLPSAGGLDTQKLIEGGQQMGSALALTPHQENAVGQEVSLALTNKYGIVNDERLTRYVILVGSTVAYRSPMDRHWVFGVLNTGDVNAFSAPGKYVLVTRGALEQMQDESELAGVLAHEIGHVNLHHGMDVIRQANFLQGLNTAAQSSGQVSQFAPASDFLVKFLTENAFSAPQEFAADAVAVKYVAAAGYDPNGLVHFLQRVRSRQKAGFKLMSTHPDVDDRIAKITNQISAAGTGGHGATLKDRFEVSTGRRPAAVQ